MGLLEDLQWILQLSSLSFPFFRFSYRILQINKGELVFPSFKILKSTPIFQRREDLIVYSNALSMEEDLMSFMEDKHFDKALEIYRKVRPEVDKTCSQLSTAERREVSLRITYHC